MRTIATFALRAATESAPALLDRLVERLVAGLSSDGYQVGRAEEMGEARVVAVAMSRGEFSVLVGAVSDRWMVSVSSGVRPFGRLLGMRRDSEREALATSVHELLQTDAEASGIRWYAEEDWAAGSTDTWTPTPDD